MKICIDRASIRRNERVGQTSTGFPGKTTLLLTLEWAYPGGAAWDVGKVILAGLEGALAVKKGRIISANSEKNRGGIVAELNYEAEPPEKTFKDLGSIVSLMGGHLDRSACKAEFIRPVQRMNHFPIRPYSFEYIPTDLTCGECGATFKHTELVDTSDEDGDGNMYGGLACPKCSTEADYALEFEKLTTEMAEAALKERVK